MNRELTTLQQALAPMGLDAGALLRRLAGDPALLARPTRLEWTLPGGISGCVSRCGLDDRGRRYFLQPYELAEEEALDLHHLTVGGRVYTFADLWQAPWPPVTKPAAAETPTAA